MAAAPGAVAGPVLMTDLPNRNPVAHCTEEKPRQELWDLPYLHQTPIDYSRRQRSRYFGLSSGTAARVDGSHLGISKTITWPFKTWPDSLSAPFTWQ